MSQPRYVALCGAPTCGKTTVAEFLQARYGAQPIDDGQVLRKAAVPLFAGTWEDFNTQRGKLRSTIICGKSYTNRQLLGQLGNLLEGHFGDQFMPERAIAEAKDVDAKVWEPAAFFVFPSVRKNQGITYLANGGVVIEVTRPGCVPVNDFDHYDQSLVSYTISNEGTLLELEAQVEKLFTETLGFRPRKEYP